MSKLSHIEDVERRAQQAQQTVTQTVAPEPETAAPEQPVSEQGDMSAEQEGGIPWSRHDTAHGNWPQGADCCCSRRRNCRNTVYC